MSSTTFICIICSEPLTSDNMFSISCGHVFHEDCMTQIISQKKYCPTCRKVATLKDVRRIMLQPLDNVQSKSESNKIKLHVKTLTGKTIVLENIKITDKILVVKSMIEYIEGIPIDKQRLKYGKVELEDGRTIDYYNIKNNETIHLVLELRGC
uniref:Uncharacterized protein n=2 Tax=Meloidogyne enterolobii TaxID=390850 RepID=A0A6V7WB55_MELEN|nr:unnamed protein product [Meloidogyne enterolobii]